MLARIPFDSPTNNLREKILKLCRVGQFNNDTIVLNTLQILAAIFPDKKSAVKKTAELSMTNLFYLIKTMEEKEKQLFMNPTKGVITGFNEQQIIQIIMRLLKIPPVDYIRDVLLSILFRCTEKSMYTLLFDLLKEHEIVKVLINYLKFHQVQYNVIVLLQFFLTGYQVSPDIFHSYIPSFEKVLSQKLEEKSPTLFYTKIIELLTIMIKLFTGYPIQYTNLIKLMNEIKEKFKLKVISDEEITEIIQVNNWFNLTKQITSFSLPVSYQLPTLLTNKNSTVNLKQNVEGYKGLANLGNSKSLNFILACYMNVIIQALFFSLKFRAEVLKIDYKKYCAVSTKGMNSPLIQLQKVFALLLRSIRPYIAPKEFRSILPVHFKNSFMQQDASEFFKTLSDLLEFDAKGVNSTNLFTKHFEGTMRRKIRCEECKTETNKEEKFVDLYIPIGNEIR